MTYRKTCEVCNGQLTAVIWKEGEHVCWPCFGLLLWIKRHGLPSWGAPPGYMTLGQVAIELGRRPGHASNLSKRKDVMMCRVYGRNFVPVAEVHRLKEMMQR